MMDPLGRLSLASAWQMHEKIIRSTSYEFYPVTESRVAAIGSQPTDAARIKSGIPIERSGEVATTARSRIIRRGAEHRAWWHFL
jgi:hypothetical protein